jgi:hypothetical protein
VNDIVLGVRLVGDSKGLVGEVRLSRQEILGLARDTQSGSKAANAGRQAAEDYAKALKKQYDTVGMSATAIKKYEVAQLSATDAEKRAMATIIDSTAATERKLQMAERLGRALGGMIVTAIQAGAALAAVVQKESLQKAMEAEQSQVKLQAVLKGTAYAAGLTAKELDDLTESMTASTRFDDEGIRNAIAIMLTFKNVNKDVFGDAMRSAASLAELMGTDLNSAVLMLGKALEEPEQGLTALRRAGVTFSDSQRIMITNMVDTGRQGEAMTAILKQLREQGIDGVAEAMNSGLTQAWSDNKKQLSELLETIGKTELVGGNAKRYFEGLTAIMRDLQLQIEGTSSRFARFFRSEEFLGSALYNKLRDLGMSSAYGDDGAGGNRARGKIDRSASEKQRAADGRSQQETQQATELAEKRFRENLKFREKDLQAEAVYIDAIYRIRSEGGQRALATEEFFRAAGLHSDAEYFAKKASLAEAAARDEVARIQKQLTITRSQEAVAGAQIKNAKSPDDRVASQEKLIALRAQEKLLVLELGNAEEKLLDVERRRAQEQFLADSKMIDRLVTIDRQTDDYVKGLDKQTSEMQFQLDIAGKSEVQQAQLNNERKIAVEYEEQRKKILREIADLEASRGSPDEIAAKQKQLETMLDASKNAGKQQSVIIANTMALRDQSKVWDEIATRAGDFFAELVTSGKSAFDVLRQGLRSFLQELIALFAKRFILSLGASMTGGTGGAALAMQASQAGSGTMAGGVLNWGSSALGLSGIMTEFGDGLTTGAMVYAPGTAGYYGSMANANFASMGGGSALAGGIVSGVVGGVVGYFGSHALGAGERGQQAGATYGATLATIGGAVYGPIGAAIGAVLGAVIGKFTDPDGLAQRTAMFGTSPDGTYARDNENKITYAGQSVFGRFGTFGDQWFGHDMSEGMQAFMALQSGVENHLGAGLTREQIAAISPQVNAPREYNFGTEHGGFESTLGAIARDRLSIIGEELIPGLGRVIDAFKGTVEELYTFVDAAATMKESLTSLDDTLLMLSGDTTAMVKAAIADLDEQVATAKTKYDEAKDSGDPAAMVEAEQELYAAVMKRYQTEITMVKDLQRAIEDLQQQSYEFSLSMAQRIIGAGGSADIAGMASSRAAALRPTIGGNYDPDGQLRRVGQYVGAVDTWYQARRSAIERDMQQQAAAAQANAAAQAAMFNARIAAVQSEIELTQQWVAVLDTASQMIDDMRLTGLSPRSAEGRLSLARGDAQLAKTAYDSAVGADKVNAANRYLQALQRELGLLPDAFQRPSPEYQAIYNEIISQLTTVQGDAKTQGDRAEELQQQLVSLQSEANAISSAGVDAANGANAELDALNKEYIEQITFAQVEGERLYALQIRQHQEQLDAITGGMEAELFIAQKTQETVDEIRGMRADFQSWLTAIANGTYTPPAGTVTGTGTGDTTGGGGKPGSEQPVNLTVNYTGTMSSEHFKREVDKALPYIKRALATA